MSAQVAERAVPLQLSPQGYPLWTRAQLEHRLVAAAGRSRGVLHDERRGPNTAVAGKYLGISERTVRRWMVGDPDEVVGMRTHSREAVYRRLRPSERKIQQEHLDRVYALEALAELRLPKRRQRIPEAWREQGWLETHMVAVLDKPYLHARQITALRIDHRNLQRMNNRGKVLSFTEVPTWFHAAVLLAAALEEVDVWRVRVPRSFLKYQQGENYCWTADAPEVDLGPLAVTNGLR